MRWIVPAFVLSVIGIVCVIGWLIGSVLVLEHRSQQPGKAGSLVTASSKVT